MKIKDFLKTHQQKLVLIIGYILVGSLGIGLGHFTASEHEIPEIRVEESFQLLNNYNPNTSGVQTQASTNVSNQALNCNGKIKGSKSMIYHLPGGAFYNKTTSPIRCFDTETDAKAAGFRKSSR
jgi:hypothetical protein